MNYLKTSTPSDSDTEFNNSTPLGSEYYGSKYAYVPRNSLRSSPLEYGLWTKLK